MNGERLRELGKVARVFLGKEDHGILTCFVHLDFGGAVQGFGGLALDDDVVDDYVRELCHAMGVAKLDDLVGVQCYALRCFDEWNTPIEGLEAMSGRRFTHTAWRRRHWPDAEDPLARKRDSLRQTISQAQRRIADARRELETVDAEYHPWPVVR